MRNVVCVAVLCLLAAASASAQSFYTFTRDVSLSGAGEVVTLQQPATGAKLVQLLGLVVTCSVACDVSIERTGTAATTTAGTPVSLFDIANAAKTSVFSASNVGSGSVISKTPALAGVPLVFDVSKLRLILNGTNHNYSVRVSSITGRAVICLLWQETTSTSW